MKISTESFVEFLSVLPLLESLEQVPEDATDNDELSIGKSDPKNGAPDYWYVIYGDIHLTGYYSLLDMLNVFAKECKRKGYA